MAKLKQLLFDFESFQRDHRSGHQSQGYALLEFLDLPLDSYINPADYLNERIISQLESRLSLLPQNNLIAALTLLCDRVRNSDKLLIADVIDLIAPHLEEEDFVLKRRYKIKQSTDASYGKWPQTLGNAFFIDSRYLASDLVDMIGTNADAAWKRNGVDVTVLINQLGDMLKAATKNGLNSFAMQVIGHIDDRIYAYIHDLRLFDRKIAYLKRAIGLDSGLNVETPLVA